MKRIWIDYTVYQPDHDPDKVCWDFDTFNRARSAARSLGTGSRIYRNFNKRGRKGRAEDWWSGKHFWMWNGTDFKKLPGGDANVPIAPVA